MTVGVPRLTVLAFLAASVCPRPAPAQQVDLSGYALGVGTHSRTSAAMPGGSGFVGRLRLMPVATFGDLHLDVAYEHVLTRSPQGGGMTITNPGGTAGSTDWLDLDWTVRSEGQVSWLHRFDRLALSFESGAFEVTAGRQAISWATTLFMTPADPFSPFDPSDPFREYRGGVDALRIRTFPGPFSELELVLRGADTPTGTTTTALLRGQTSLGGGVWSVGAWAGALHDEAAAAAFLTGSVGSTALRAEATVREHPDGGAALRVSTGMDRYFRPAGRDLYVIVEYQHDGFGASEASELVDAATSRPYLRGELQSLGANTLALQASYQLSPLISLAVLGLNNLDDFSELFSVSLGWSAGQSTSVSLGTFMGVGDDTLDPVTGFGSEYGLVPFIGYASVSWYF